MADARRWRRHGCSSLTGGRLYSRRRRARAGERCRQVRTAGVHPAAERARGGDDELRPRLEVAGAVALAGILPAPDEGVELDRALAEGLRLARRGDEERRPACRVQRGLVAAHEVRRVGPRELLPRQAPVAAGRAQLVAEHRDRPLAVRVHEREGTALRLRRDHGPNGHALLGQLRAAPPPELVVAEDGEERRLDAEPHELHRGDRPAAGGLLPRLDRMDDLAGLRHVLDAGELDPLDVPDDDDLHRRSLTFRRARAFHRDDGRRDGSALRALLRGLERRDPRLPAPPPRRGRRRGRVPGDVPARAPRLRPARARARAARVGVHDRGARRHGRPSPAATGGRGRRGRRRRQPARLRGDRAPRERAAADRARRGRPPLRLRPELRGHRRRPGIERRRRAAGHLLRNPPPTQKGAPVTTVPDSLDRRFRAAAASSGLLDVTYDLFDSPLGTLLLAASERGLCRISYDPEPERETDVLATRFGVRVLRAPLEDPRRQLDEYFEGPRHSFELPLDLAGVGPFPRQVLEELALVPYGEVTTYGRLAAQVERPRAARAVGTVMNRNPLPIVLPCHRVVGSTGKLVGYGGGAEGKEGLPRPGGAPVSGS